MRVEEVVKRLESLGDAKAVEGMARFGITAETVYGVSMPRLRLSCGWDRGVPAG